ncbi:hypothetical protein GGX14DRAFT_566356 [Mycena pura]|uniref:Uncharacterized protein n=1 Tax=Mycena pura TaxID=153505 RepID=A0AAD6YGU8_9AGAR|nr:hypothetical protein GGX14DRAFT_566356 [Mycena pura]
MRALWAPATRASEQVHDEQRWCPPAGSARDRPREERYIKITVSRFLVAMLLTASPVSSVGLACDMSPMSFELKTKFPPPLFLSSNSLIDLRWHAAARGRRDDFSGQSWKRHRQRQSSPASSGSDAASTGSTASASSILASSLSASDTASLSVTSSTAFISTISDTISSSVPTTTTTTTVTDTPTSTTSTDDPDPPSSVVPPTTTTSVIASTSPPLSATTDSDTDSPSTTTSTSDTGTASPPLSATTTESDSDSPPASTVNITTGSASDVSSSVPTATIVPSSSVSDGVSFSDTTSISASISTSSADAPSSSSVLSALPPSPSHSSIQLSSIAPAAAGSIKTPVFSFPSITLEDNFASPAAPIQAPTELPLPPTPTTVLDVTSTAVSTYIGVAAVAGSPSGAGSLFTTTRVYTSHGSVYTSVSTGVLGTGRPVPHDFAHNAGAIVGVALGGVVLLILVVLGVFCARHRFRSRARREFLRFGAGAARAAPRRGRGASRAPIDGDSVYSLVSDGGDDHGDASRSLLHAESGMRETRTSQGPWGSAQPFRDAETPDLLSMHDVIWTPTPPSSLSIPALLPVADDGPRRASDLSMPSRSSLLNPPLVPSPSTVTVALPAAPPQPEWPGLRSAITHSVLVPLPPGAGTEPTPSITASDPDPPPSPAPTEGLLRPSLTVLQSHSSRTFDDHVDYSRLIGAQRTGSGKTVDTASSKAGSSGQ